MRAAFKAFLTGVLRGKRLAWTERFSPELGDILVYQSRGAAIRTFIRKKIDAAKPPVYLLAHSLGGIACVDLLGGENPPKVACLITAGSQAPLLYGSARWARSNLRRRCRPASRAGSTSTIATIS